MDENIDIFSNTQLQKNNYVLNCKISKDQYIILEFVNIAIIKNIYKLKSVDDNSILLSIVNILITNDLYLSIVIFIMIHKANTK